MEDQASHIIPQESVDPSNHFTMTLDEADRVLERQHTAAILEAHARHERVRERALKAMELYDLEQQSMLLAEEERQNRLIQDAHARLAEQEARLKEAEKVAEQRRAAALEAERSKPSRPVSSLEMVDGVVPKQERTPSLNGATKDTSVTAHTTASLPAGRESDKFSVSSTETNSVTHQSAFTPDIPSSPQTAGKTTIQPGSAAAFAQQNDRTQVTGHQQIATSSNDPSRIATLVHAQYVNIHQQLKKFRKYMSELGKQDSRIKSLMGDQRRELNKIVGQMTSGSSEEVRNANRDRIRRVRDVLQRAMDYRAQTVDIRNFVAPFRAMTCSESEAQVSALHIYLLNQLSKIVIRQYIREAGISPEKAEAVGLLVASVFTQRIPTLTGDSYTIDILLAKYHVRSPILFGINKFPRDPDSTLQEDLEKITGLAAGYAAITLRDFSKTSVKNPVPPAMLWRTLASIANTAVQKRQDGHYQVLKAFMHPTYVTKFLRFYGDVALALIRAIVIKFPEGSTTSGAQALKATSLIFERDLGLQLEA